MKAEGNTLSQGMILHFHLGRSRSQYVVGQPWLLSTKDGPAPGVESGPCATPLVSPKKVESQNLNSRYLLRHQCLRYQLHLHCKLEFILFCCLKLTLYCRTNRLTLYHSRWNACTTSASMSSEGHSVEDEVGGT